MNSIQEEIEKHPVDKIAEVKQAYNSSLRDYRVMILVEGEDDENFYRNYADDSNVYVYAMMGCDWMQPTLQALNPRYKNKLAAIKDADFDRLNKNLPSLSNLFLTDEHDHEMMCVSKEKSAEIAEHYKVDKTTAQDIHLEIITNITPFSEVKWYCSMAREYYKLFEGNDSPGGVATKVSFKKCKAANHYGLNREENISRINLRQAVNWSILNSKDIERFLSRRAKPDHRQLINGHDYCGSLGEAIRRIKSRTIGKKEIPSLFRKKFTLTEFLSTDLATSLTAYFSPRQIWKHTSPPPTSSKKCNGKKTIEITDTTRE